jgi:16S rRNA (cytosine1402-N4)-methyltransferase
MESHEPVLLEPVLEVLSPNWGGTLVDATTGLGGHSLAIAERLTGEGRLIAIDRDPESLAKSRERLSAFSSRVTFVNAKFSELRKVLDSLAIATIDGLLADFGVSRFQLTAAHRGFSFESSESLDMRMSQSEDTPTASELVNFGSEEEIARVLWELGEERRARRAARAIVRARPIRSTQRLADIIESAIPRTGRIRSSTRSLQALRMYVNSELEQIEELMRVIPACLASGARAAVIAFHSLEDRIVKRQFMQWRNDGRAQILTKHVVTPGEEEMWRNPASRSARLRALQWN